MTDFHPMESLAALRHEFGEHGGVRLPTPRPTDDGAQSSRPGIRRASRCARSRRHLSGLPDHPDHDIIRRLRNEEFNFGGILAVDVGSRKNAESFMEVLQNEDRFGFMAVSLGYFDTLMSAPAQTTSSELTADEKEEAGIRPGLVRMSIGYTDSLEQRWRQLEDAVAQLELAELKS